MGLGGCVPQPISSAHLHLNLAHQTNMTRSHRMEQALNTTAFFTLGAGRCEGPLNILEILIAEATP